jgi:Tfp pilus assembly PilM family ATPase/Tfp pilus assembly protein PilN
LTVTINISSQSLKITSGKQAMLEKWSTLQIVPGLIKDGLILEPDIIGKQLKAHFDNERLSRNDVVVSLTGASCIYRMLRLPKIPAKRLREAVERATQKEIHLDLADLYIDWDVIGKQGGETEVFVTGMPRRSIESLLKTLNIAGIKPKKIDLSPLALARAVDKYETVLVNFEPYCYDIAIISGGIPVTLNSVLPRTRGENLDDQVMQLTDELTRTIDFYNLTHKDNLILPGASLILSGSLAAEPAGLEPIQKTLGFSVSILSSETAYPPGFPFDAYSVNLGLVPKKNIFYIRDSKNEKVYRDVDINLLRGRKRALARKHSIRQMLIPAGLALAAFMLTPAFIFVNNSRIQSAALKSDLASTIHLVTQRQIELEQDSELHNKIDAINQDTSRIQREMELVAGKGYLNRLIQVIIEDLPPGAWLSEIVCETRLIAINGQATDRPSVISYARNLENTQKFSSVRIAFLDQNKDKSSLLKVVFEIVVER